MVTLQTLVFHQRQQMLTYFNSSDVPFVTTSSLDEAGLLYSKLDWQVPGFASLERAQF